MGTAHFHSVMTFAAWDGPSKEDGSWLGAQEALSVCAGTTIPETVSETFSDLVFVSSGDSQSPTPTTFLKERRWHHQQ